MTNLGDGVLGSASGAEPVQARAEVRLEDRLQHQLQGRLHDPVTGGRDAKAAEFPTGLGDHRLPHRQRFEPSGLEIISQPGQQFRCPEDDRAGFHSIDSGRPCPPVAPNPLPRNHEEGGIGDEVVEVIEPTLGIVGSPLVQLGLHPQYPQPGSVTVWPRLADVHRRTPGIAFPLLRACCLPSPCTRLSRARTTTEAPPHPRAVSRRRACPSLPWLGSGEGGSGMVPTFTMYRSAGSVPSSSPAASPWVRRRLSPWPPGPLENRAPESPCPPCGSARTASRPASTRLEPVPRLRGFNHWFTLVTPVCLACRARAVWQCRPAPSLSGLLAALPCTSRVRLRSASASLLRQTDGGSFHPAR